MSSFVYSSFIDDMARNTYEIPASDYKAMFVTSHYAANKDHTRRSQVTDEVVGIGYKVRGYETSLSISRVGEEPTIHMAPFKLSEVDFKARGVVLYRANGGRSVDDELVAYIDFEGTYRFRGSFEFSLSADIQFK